MFCARSVSFFMFGSFWNFEIVISSNEKLAFLIWNRYGWWNELEKLICLICRNRIRCNFLCSKQVDSVNRCFFFVIAFFYRKSVFLTKQQSEWVQVCGWIIGWKSWQHGGQDGRNKWRQNTVRLLVDVGLIKPNEQRRKVGKERGKIRRRRRRKRYS